MHFSYCPPSYKGKGGRIKEVEKGGFVRIIRKLIQCKEEKHCEQFSLLHQFNDLFYHFFVFFVAFNVGE